MQITRNELAIAKRTKRHDNRVNATHDKQEGCAHYEKAPCEGCVHRSECRSKALACESYRMYSHARASKRKGWELAPREPNEVMYENFH